MNLRDELSDRQRPSDPDLDNDHVDPTEPGDPPGDGDPPSDGDPPESDPVGDIYTDP